MSGWETVQYVAVNAVLGTTMEGRKYPRPATYAVTDEVGTTTTYECTEHARMALQFRSTLKVLVPPPPERALEAQWNR